jgi:protein MON2
MYAFWTNQPALISLIRLKALLLCFKLQDSRIAVVSSTAAATLRQLVMFVVDKVVDEDRAEPSDQNPTLTTILLPDESSVDLQPSARDAFSVFEDLCLLANSERPKFLKLESLHKTFALELIESVLTNYHDLFHKARALPMLSNPTLTVAYYSIRSFSFYCNISCAHFSSNHFQKDPSFP